MKRMLVLLCGLICSMTSYSQGSESKEEVAKTVSDFVRLVRSGNKAKVAKIVRYPLSRHYPVPDIKNEQEFLKRYNEVFDNNLKQRILKSDPKEDWGGVGWHGIMLDCGIVWLDYDGSCIAVNYESKIEKQIRMRLIQKDKEMAHRSLKAYKEPMLVMETKKYRVRVDEMEDGKYRYASWEIDKKMNMQPDIVINGGERIFEGTGGNHHYEFKNGVYRYECSIVVIGADDDPPAFLYVYKQDKEEPVLEQRALKLLN